MKKDQKTQKKLDFRLKNVFLGVDRDKSGRIGFFGSSGGTSGFGLQIGTVPTRSGRLASMQRQLGVPWRFWISLPSFVSYWKMLILPPAWRWQIIEIESPKSDQFTCTQSEKFLDLGTVTRPPCRIYARVTGPSYAIGALAYKGTRETCFDDHGFFGLSSQKHHT